jgi:hypothetical protein
MFVKIASIATAALIAVTVAAPAHAVLFTGRNGVELNGVQLNGPEVQGRSTQGTVTGATSFAIDGIELPTSAR